MSAKKQFKLKADEIAQLIPYMGGCIAPDTITIEGMKVKFMYRDVPRKIIPYLNLPVGTKLERIDGTDTFVIMDQTLFLMNKIYPGRL